MIDQKDIDELRLTGLSLNQAKIYLTLLSTGKSTVKVISRVAEIDRANTSRAIATLEELALIKKTIGVPNLYEPLPVQDALDILLKKKNEENAQIQIAAKTLVNKFHNFPNLESSKMITDENLFIMIPEKTAYLQMGHSLWQNVEHTVDLISSTRRISGSNNVLITTMKQALERGVSVRSIQAIKLGNRENSSKTKRYQHLFSKYQWEERVTESSFIVGAIFDKKVGFFVMNPELIFPKSPCILTNNEGFIGVQQYYFDGLWSTSEPI